MPIRTIALKLLDIEQQTINWYTLVTESREHERYRITSVPVDNIIEARSDFEQRYIGFYPNQTSWGIYINECFITSFEFYGKVTVSWDNFNVLKFLGSKINEYNKNNT